MTGSLMTFWDHCLMRSNMSNDVFFVTIGHVPETITKGTTADTSHIAEFGWYDCVCFKTMF